MNVDILRIVVVVLGIVCCLCVGGIILLASSGHDSPQALVIIGSNAMAALIGILVNPGRAFNGNGTNGGGGNNSGQPSQGGNSPSPSGART